MASRSHASAPFVSRELNGELLIDELVELRAGQVPQKTLNEVVGGLRDLQGVRPAEAAATLKQLASSRFSGQPALAALLVRWAGRLKSELDVPLLVGHLERLVVTSALVTALRRASDTLPRAGRG